MINGLTVVSVTSEVSLSKDGGVSCDSLVYNLSLETQLRVHYVVYGTENTI